MRRLAIIGLLGFITLHASLADTYRFNQAVDQNWSNTQNWQNQTLGINGWQQAGGIPLPGSSDIVRFNYGGSHGKLSANAGEIDALQIGVDEPGHLTLLTGAVLTTSTGQQSGMGTGAACAGTLTIEDGLLTIQNGWSMGMNINAHEISLVMNGGEMRVASSFNQSRQTATATTTLNGGLLDVDSLNLSAGTINIAGGTLVVRSGDVRAEVAAWNEAGLMLAYGGQTGAVIEMSYSNGQTEITAVAAPLISVPNLIGLSKFAAESLLTDVGLKLGKLSLNWNQPESPKPGTVHSQSPNSGEEVVEESKVDLTLVAPQISLNSEEPILELHPMDPGEWSIFWPAEYGSYEPETTINLTGSPVWDSVSSPTVQSLSGYCKFEQTSEPKKFYRLRKTTVDPSTLYNKSMMGYQGWFGTPTDGTPVTDRWHHWGNGYPEITDWGIDFYPDMTEYTTEERYDTGWTLNNGETAYLFSSAHPRTVERHCRWMWEYGIDGVFLQRFIGEVQDPRFFSFRNTVTENMRAGAEKYGRLFVIMYDLSGVSDSNLLAYLTADWDHLVNTMKVTESPSYAQHNGKPVICIWGLGFVDRGLQPTTAQAIIDYFKNQQGMTVMGGVPAQWRTLNGDSESDPAWATVYRSFDIISPWTVGRYNSTTGADNWRTDRIVPDLAAATDAGVDYMPVIFPGFSWKNIHDGPLNQIPRLGGDFYWRQAYNAQRSGCSMLYTAMFDEMDEGTAMLKMAPTLEEIPSGATMVPLNIDGLALPSDWYLQVGGAAAKMLHGDIVLQEDLPISP